jgi:PAS domain S-box-containing protein
MIGKTDRNILGKEDAEKLTAIKRKVMETGEPFQLETSLQNSNGQTEFFEGTYIPKFDATGQADGLIGYFRNITERKRAEAALKKVEADYRLLAENSPDLVARFDSGLRHLYANPAAAQAGKLAAGEYVGLTIAEAGVPEPLATTWNQRIEQVLRTRRILDVEGAFPTPQGSRYFHARLVPELAPDGSVCSVLSIARDITDRRQAEDELNRFFDLVPDLVCIASTDGFFKRINGAWQAALGYSQEELLATPFVDLIHPDDREATLVEIAKQVAGESTSNFINRYRCKDGSYRWLEWLATPAVDKTFLFAAARDVTEHKRADEALRERERELFDALEFNRKIVTTSSIGILTYNKSGQCVSANAAAGNVGGATVAQLLAQNFHEVSSWKKSGMYQAAIRALDSGIEQLLDVHLVTTFGKDVWLSLSFSSFDSEGERHLLVFTFDITERKRAEDALHESESSYRTLFEQSPDAVVVLDPETTLPVDFNDEACRRLGYSREEFARLRIADYDADHTPAEIQASIREILATGTAAFEARHRTKQGDVRNIWISVRVLETGGQTVCYSISRDITERKRAEERMRTFSHEIIAAREAERKQVSSDLHHDVGSLAVGVSAHLDAIEGDLRSGKPGEALKWTKRTRKLFDESVARLKEVAVQLRPPELDALGLCAALRQHFSRATKHGGTRIHFRETLGRRRVSGDAATTLFRVAQETLTNAITHGDAKQVNVYLSASKNKVRLTVRDNGKGFSPSGQTGQATSRMGLRVMKEMAASSGGGFEIHSRRGRGTTVRVSLPLTTAVLGPRDV